MIEWSPQQARAIDAIREWHACKRDGEEHTPVFRLFGYAGTGKSTLAEYLPAACETAPRIKYATLTGKAAQVLRSKGCPGAQTIHSMIYRSLDKSCTERDIRADHLKRIKGDPETNRDEIERIERELAKMDESLRQPSFLLNTSAFKQYWDRDLHEYVPIDPPDLIVIDECSMVDERIGEDLLSFHIPILVLGDPAQLPPVAGGGFFTEAKPDALLTEIHRQAAGNPIIQMATTVRSGQWLTLGEYGDSRVVMAEATSPADWLEADQILVGKNDTRRAINGRVRTLRGFTGFLPCPGEKLVCLRNSHDEGLLNGSLWECVASVDHPDSTLFTLFIRNEEGREVECIAHKSYFLGFGLEDWRDRLRANEFDFGYALTVHKAQGSQWDNVVLMDEWTNRSSKAQWQYTGITRAAKRITVVRR